jgi:RNA polymerase sigma factor (sigma-70 family)
MRWGELAIQARDGGEAFERLLAELEPLIREMSRRLCSTDSATSDAEDACQVARLALWKILPNVDTSRSDNSVKAWLTHCVVNAIRDECRHQRKRTPGLLGEDDGLLLGVGTVSLRALSMSQSMPNLLRMYLTHVRQTGTFDGAHDAVAARLGCHPTTARREYRRLAAAWGSRYQQEHQ